MRRVAYFDASAIVKLSGAEPESMALVDYLSEPMEASTSCLSEVEVSRAIRRSRVSSPDQAQILSGFFFLNIDREIRHLAARIGGPSLRSLDAIHLASALSLRIANLEFVTYDNRQADEARALGLCVVQPGH